MIIFAAIIPSAIKTKFRMSSIKIKSALISVFYKDGLDDLLPLMKEQGITIYSTGGTYDYIINKGFEVEKVEDLTSYPSILGGRVKTLHPKIFGGILAKRDEDHLAQLANYEIPEIDLVIVDLYPFEETVKNTTDESQIIEKIDIGGIALIRATAKNFNDVVIVPSREDYSNLMPILQNKSTSTLEQRKQLAKRAFEVSSSYDTAIHSYFDSNKEQKNNFNLNTNVSTILRYGENPHQKGVFFGELNNIFEKLSGKDLSYNNLVDVDAAVELMAEFKDEDPCFAVLKHTNACGLAIRPTVLEAWKDALAGDPISAFGGVLICNSTIDLETAKEIDKLFYEVLLAKDFTDEAFELLTKKSKRVLIKINHFYQKNNSYKSVLNGVIQQDGDLQKDKELTLTYPTKVKASSNQVEELLFAGILAKHLKSNTIVFTRNRQLLGMGCGQTSRVDACRYAIAKAQTLGFDLKDSVMASDAFFPFPDSIELANEAGVTAVIQPGGSIKDQLSIDYCDENNIAMVLTGVRHFKH